MTEPLKSPGKKNPQKRTLSPTLPPFLRSRKALAFTVIAAEGRFALQKCEDCGQISHPPREACPNCLSMTLFWHDVSSKGTLISETTIRTSTNIYFRERTPWRVGTVQLDEGPAVLAHIHNDVPAGGRIKMIARTDKSGQGVLMALPIEETSNMADEAKLRELTCDPKHRRVLITDGRTELGQAMAKAVSEAGASTVFIGLREQWRGQIDRNKLAAIANAELVPLDLSDTDSVTELAGEFGGKVDILINTAEHVRPGGAMNGKDIVTARDEMEINYFGLLRLAQAFGSPMASRGADGSNSATAWVNLFSVYALSNHPTYGSTSASQAAAYSLSQCIRAEFRGSGVKVLNVLCGPIEEEWRQPLPPPKVSPHNLAKSVIGALQQGLEELSVGAVADDLVARWKENPRVLERELTQAHLE